ncbi:MAG: DNA polymerase III subunit delta' [Syntrophorhabdaceae bacterium]
MAFEDIIGHDRQKKFLKFILEHGNIAHAFLFCGQEGIGKKAMALEFARHLFCQKKTGCGTCRPCLKLERGSHPDLMMLQDIHIDDSRMITKEVTEQPYESEKRVIIIDNAETMNTETSNALLKTLEEPPPFNHFFLITSSEREIPMTIRSRCTRVSFSQLSALQLKQYFIDCAAVQPDHATLLSSISFGSIGNGLFWLDGNNFLLRTKLAEAICGRTPGFSALSSLAEQVSLAERNASMYLAFLLSFFRDLFVKTTIDDTSFVVNKDLEDMLSEAQGGPEWIEHSIKRIQETIRVMRYNVNRWLILENLLIQITGNR